MSNARNLGNITAGGATGATTASVTTSINNLIDASPGALNTLNELAAALGDDANFSTTVTNSIATKLPLAGGTMTGNLIVPQVVVDNITMDGNDISTTNTNGALTITPNGTGDLQVNSDRIKVRATEGESASIMLAADEQDDAGDSWSIKANTDNTFVIQNDISGAADVTHFSIIPNATVANSVASFAGKVGIGTVNPAFKLQVYGTGNTAQVRIKGSNNSQYDFYAYSDNNFYINNPNGTILGLLENKDAYFGKNLGIGDSVLSTYHTSYPALELGSSASVQGYTGANGAWLQSNLFMNTNGQWTSKSDDYSAMLELYDGNFTFYNTASGTGTRTLLTPMTIRQNGNVGIGASTGVSIPVSRLNVRAANNHTNGSDREDLVTFHQGISAWQVGRGAGIRWVGDVSRTMAGISSYVFGTEQTGLAFETGGANSTGNLKPTTRMVIDHIGKVGIGVTNPSSFNSGAHNLVVGNTSATSQGITIAADTNSIMYFADGTSGAEAYMGSIIYNHSDNNMTFRTNGFNSAMVIDSSQNVGIGTASPSSPLHVLKKTMATGIETVARVDATTNAYGKGPSLDFNVLWGGYIPTAKISAPNVSGGNGYGGDLVFSTGGQSINTMGERMRITPLGKLQTYGNTFHIHAGQGTLGHGNEFQFLTTELATPTSGSWYDVCYVSHSPCLRFHGMSVQSNNPGLGGARYMGALVGTYGSVACYQEQKRVTAMNGGGVTDIDYRYLNSGASSGSYRLQVKLNFSGSDYRVYTCVYGNAVAEIQKDGY